MNRDLLVIGGKTGIGKAIAQEAFYLDGYYESIATVGPEECNVADGFTTRCYIEDHGPFTDVVYCPGKAYLSWISELDMNEVKDVYNVNVLGFMRVLSALTNFQLSGRVVAIGSDAGRLPMRGSIAYCSSKAALHMAVRVAARELAPNWQINAVAPGIVDDTPMTEWIDASVPPFRGWSEEQAHQYEQSLIPMGRRCYKSEIAEVVLNTLKAPNYLTGAIIDLTGGK